MPAVNAITISGNLAADPELRRTAAEVPYTRLRVAVSHRVRSADGEGWEDRRDGFFNVTTWRDLALHADASLRRGDRVTVTGRLVRRAYDVDLGDGRSETRHVHEIEADDLGPSLRFDVWGPLARQDGEAGGRRPRTAGGAVGARTTSGRVAEAEGGEGSAEEGEEPDVAPAA